MKGSGIPALRSYCHKIPARAQFRIADHFLSVRLKDFVQRVQLWLTGGSQETLPSDKAVVKLMNTLQNDLQQVSFQVAWLMHGN
jgi:UDP-N-acetylglucosamine:LPS N-acetylglucosamine transferase